MRQRSPLFALAQLTVSAAASLAGSWILYSRLAVDHNLTLDDAVDASRGSFPTKNGGYLSYYADISAERIGEIHPMPLVLIHSINAAGSSYETRPIFHAYCGSRDVYALDLPGFGFSSRDDRVYSPEVYKDAILDLLERIGRPADVVVLSLSSEFAALAALERSDLFHSLTMISPTGFNRRDEQRASQAASQSGTSGLLYRLFSFPLWSQAFYDLLGTRKSIHYYLQMSFEGPVAPDLQAYSYQTTHQPGAKYAPLYFVSGKLFTPDVRPKVYDKLGLPVLVLYDRDAFVHFDTLPKFVDQHANWHAVRIEPTKGLPQFEQLAAVTRELDAFWQRISVHELS